MVRKTGRHWVEWHFGYAPAPGAFGIAACAFLLGVLLSGCAHSAPLAGPGYLQVDIENSPLSLDPRFATDAISQRITELMFDSLVKLDRQSQFVGDVAESIERPTPTTLIFHLRHGIRFSDGRPLTARDVKYTYDSVMNPATLSAKRAGLAPLASVTAPDAYTVVMTTRRPYAPALEMAMLGIVPYGSRARGARSEAPPPGTGPFRLARFARGEAVVLSRNPFRPHPASALPGIFFKVVPDPTVRALELEEGVCDFAENNVEPDVLGHLAAQPNLEIVTSPGTAYQYIAFNFRDRRLRDLRVRRAIAYAIDRKAIVNSILRGTARVATGMLSPENWAYDGDVMRYPYNPVLARRLLEEAGYAIGPGGGRHLTLVYKTTPQGRRLAEVLQAMLKKVGIRLEVRTNEWATFYGDIQRGNFDVTSMQWVGITDPHHYYMVFDSKMTPPHGLNRGAYKNPEMDKLLEAGDATLDREQRRKIYGQAQKLAAEDLPYVSLWWLDNVAVMNHRLSGFEPYPNGSLRSLARARLATTGKRERPHG